MTTQARNTAHAGRKAPKEGRREGPGSAHVAKLETRLERWGARLDDLVAKAEEAGTEAKRDYRDRVAELKSKYKVAQAKVDEVRAAGSETWDGFKAGVERAWADLDASFQKLRTPAPASRRARPATVTARRAARCR